MNVVEKSTGAKTYNLHKNKPVLSDNNVLLIKIHARSKFIARSKALWLLPPHTFAGKYIYTYRDPRDAIISLYEFHKHRTGLSFLTPQQFLKDYDPIGQYRREIGAWVLPRHADVLLVKFEALRQSPQAEFQRIFRYLDLDRAIDAASIDESVAQAESTQRPRRTAYGWKSAPATYRGLIETVSSALVKEVQALQYEPL
jgi:hypothetical protein